MSVFGEKRYYRTNCPDLTDLKARWVERLRIGDIIVIEHLRIREFQSTLVGNTTFGSRLTILDTVVNKDGSPEKGGRFDTLSHDHPWMAEAIRVRKWGARTYSSLGLFAKYSGQQTLRAGGQSRCYNSQFTAQITPDETIVQEIASMSQIPNFRRKNADTLFRIEFKPIAIRFKSGAHVDAKSGVKLKPKEILCNLFIGCSRCEAALSPDPNGVYHCQHCSIPSPGSPSVRWFYHEVEMQIIDSCARTAGRASSPSSSAADPRWIRVGHREVCQLAAGITPRHISVAIPTMLKKYNFKGGMSFDTDKGAQENKLANELAADAADALNTLVQDTKAGLKGLLMVDTVNDPQGMEIRGQIILQTIEKLFIRSR